jgi:hypothetical protein
VSCSGDYDFYSREEVEALARAAASEQDSAIYLTAAMTGLRRGELVALRWRDIDFPGQAIGVRANYSYGELVTPKSGKIRSVPMVPDVAQALARLGQRERFTGDAAAIARCRSGTSTGRGKRQLALTHGLGRVAQRLGEIVSLQVREGLEDLRVGHPVGEHANDRRDRDPQPSNTRHATHLGRIHSDARKSHRTSAYLDTRTFQSAGDVVAFTRERQCGEAFASLSLS